jgi:multidrug efflux pump subunit AcrB
MYYLYGMERLIQLSTESAFGIFSIIGGLILLGTSVVRAIVIRKIATRRRKLMGKVLTDQNVTRTTEINDSEAYS